MGGSTDTARGVSGRRGEGQRLSGDPATPPRSYGSSRAGRRRAGSATGRLRRVDDRPFTGEICAPEDLFAGDEAGVTIGKHDVGAPLLVPPVAVGERRARPAVAVRALDPVH